MNTNKKVLVADDEADLREPVSDALRASGYTVLEAKDGEEAVALALKEHPDIILMDIFMPKKTGTEALHEIRKDVHWGIHVPVIMLTAMTDPANVTNAVGGGTVDYLIKTNWTLDEIIKKVKANIVQHG